jgi:hypothetical protein
MLLSTVTKSLVALFLAVLSEINPAAPKSGRAYEVGLATALAVQRAELPGYSKEETVAIMATMAWHESNVNPWAIGPAHCVSGDCTSYGAWQADHRKSQLGNAYYQADWYLDLMRRSVALCPTHPLAPITTGYCSRYQLADERMAEALAAYWAVYFRINGGHTTGPVSE